MFVPRSFRLGAFIASGVLAATTALAQDFPVKPVRWIVPFAAGGGPDVIARIVGQKLTETLGHQVIIDNRTGAGGNVGSAIAAKSPPDGYTVLLGIASPMAINVTLYGARLPYSPADDFAPVSMIVKVPQFALVHPSVPARTLPQLIALAKQDPGKLNYGSGGNGTTGHLIVEMVKTATGFQVTHVPFRTSAQSVAAVLAGQVDMVVGSASTFLPQVKAGRLRPIVVSTRKRSPVFPEVPTMIESGVRDFDASSWYCMVAPAGTPRAIVDRLRGGLVKALDAPDVRSRLLGEGAPPEPSTPEDLGAFIRAEIVKWGAAVKASGAKVD